MIDPNRIRARRVTHSYGTPVHALFEYLDTKGRRFGACARIDVIEYVAADESDFCPYRVPADHLGVWFQVQPHATRDGHHFGALQPHHIFRTEEEAKEYIGTYFAAAEKRARSNKARAV